MVLTGSSGCSMLSNAYKQVKKCECVDDFMISYRNKVFAQRAWIREKHCHSNQPFLDEYKEGFFAGYIDVASGGNGCLPCTAPSQYWGWKYQSPGGQSAINAWYAGFPMGVKAAEQDGLGNWSQVRPLGQQPYTDPNLRPAEGPIGSAVILGPDGSPLPPDSMDKESETVLPAPYDFEPMEMDTFEILEPPVSGGLPEPDAGLLNGPSLDDEVLLDPPQTDLVPRSESGLRPAGSQGTVQSSEFESSEFQSIAEAETLVPRQTSPTYSLDDLGDDAIEGIFGALEMPGNTLAASSDPAESDGNSATSLESETAVEATIADRDEIPFKFE
jgi:hypothetical protein